MDSSNKAELSEVKGQELAKQTCWIGIDISKDSLDVGVWPSGETRRFCNTAEAIEELGRLCATLKPEKVCTEAAVKPQRGMKSPWRVHL